MGRGVAGAHAPQVITGDHVPAARRGWVAAAAGLILLLLAANFELLFGDVTPLWDADNGFAPWFLLVSDYAHEGRLLRWNPWSAGGSPDFADPQLGAFSPLTVGVGALAGGTVGAFWAYWLLIWSAGGLGALLLARHLGAPPWGGFVVAAGFAFSGYFTGHATHTSFLHAYAALPWIAWRLDRAMKPGGSTAAAQAGAIWGLSALAGYPGQVAANAGYAVLWLLGRAFFPDEDREAGRTRRFGRAAVVLLVFLAVGLVVLAPAYVSLVRESQGVSARAGPLPREVATGSNALHPLAVLTFASPYLTFLKLLDQDRLWPYTDVTSGSIYAGAVVTWLAGVALVARPRDGWRWWLLGCGVAGVLLALGQALPFRGWLYDLVPPSRYTRHASLFTGYLILSASALAAVATRDLSVLAAEPPRSRARFLVTAIFVALASFAAFATGSAAAVRDDPAVLAGALFHLALMWTGVLTTAWATMRLDGPARPRVLAAALGLLAVADGVATQALSRPLLYDYRNDGSQRWGAIRSNRVRSLDVRWGRSESWGPGAGNRNVVVKEPVLAAWAPLYSLLHQAWAETPVLAASAIGSDRVYFSKRIVEAPSSMATFRLFVKRTAALGAPPLVVHSRPAMRAGEGEPDEDEAWAIARLPPAQVVPSHVVSYTPDALTLSVFCPAEGWLWVTERWSRSWEATVNGRPVDVWGGNFIFRAVPVGRGANVVRFTYRPAGLSPLVVLSWGTLGAVALISMVPALRRRRLDRGR
jgi:hypothetical protein